MVGLITKTLAARVAAMKAERDALGLTSVTPKTLAARVAAMEHEKARVESLTEALNTATAALVAAISLLERTPKANKAAPSDKMFKMMLGDYRKAAEVGRAALADHPAEAIRVASDDAVRALRARYDLLHADALARQRGVYLDGSPRRETVPVPADPMAQPFTPVTLGGGTGSTSADPVRNKLVAALKEIDALASPIAEQGQDADELRRRIYHIRQAASSALALARIEDERQ